MWGGCPYICRFPIYSYRRLRKLCLVKFEYLTNDFVQVHALKLRLRHFGEFAEPADDRLQMRDFLQQRGCALSESFIELFLPLLARAKKVLDRQLKRKQWILELVGQASRQFPPCGDALGLHQPLLLIE